MLLAVHHRIAAPWHIYWRNPGESGLSTKLELGGSGFTAGPVQYPAPERIVATGGQVSYGWERDAVLFVPIELGELGDESKPVAKPEAEQAEQAEPAKPASGYLEDALAQLAAGGAITTASPQAYGCSVKYADAGDPAIAKLGEPAPAFELPKLDGETVALADFAGKTVVLEWFNPDCPFVKYAHGEGPLAGMAATQTKSGVVWLAINSGAPGKQGHGAERNREAKAEWKLDHPILLDEDGKVGHLYGATSTPHMFVIDGAGKLVYAGALDNAPLGRALD